MSVNVFSFLNDKIEYSTFIATATFADASAKFRLSSSKKQIWQFNFPLPTDPSTVSLERWKRDAVVTLLRSQPGQPVQDEGKQIVFARLGRNILMLTEEQILNLFLCLCTFERSAIHVTGDFSAADLTYMQTWAPSEATFQRYDISNRTHIISFGIPDQLENLATLWDTLQEPVPVASLIHRNIPKEVSDVVCDEVVDQAEVDDRILYGFMDSCSRIANEVALLSEENRSHLPDITTKVTTPLMLAHAKRFDGFGGSQRWSQTVLLQYRQQSTRWHPKPDVRFEYIGSELPCMVFEFVSPPNETDRYRLLAQCQVYLRIAHVMDIKVRCGSAQLPVVMAIYIPKNLMADVYLLTMDEDLNQVLSLCYTVDFKTPLGRCQLLLACHNFLSAQVPLSSEKLSFLQRIFSYQLSGDVKSQTAELNAQREKRKLSKQGDGASKQVSKEGGGSSKRRGEVTDALSLSAVARSIGLSIRHFETVVNHKHVAFCTYSNGQNAVLKIVPPGNQEANILKCLSAIRSPSNPILPGISINPIPSFPSYSLIEMPRAALVDSAINNAVDLALVATQLLSGVMFLHAHNIVHLDLKPSNLVVLNTGKICIIDFSVSEFVERGVMLQGFRGTPGYVAPEVVKGGPFDPFLTDVWACGNVLLDIICNRTDSTLPLISNTIPFITLLTANDPDMRPTLSAVLTILETSFSYTPGSHSMRKRRHISFSPPASINLPTLRDPSFWPAIMAT